MPMFVKSIWAKISGYSENVCGRKMILVQRAFVLLATLVCVIGCEKQPPKKPGEYGYQRPNFLFIISDDQSWEHTSFAGYPYVDTPNFDKIARQGMYFENAYATAPSCTASRSSVLTGQYPWRLKSAAVIGGEWPSDIQTYPQILEKNGYHVGYTGKGWGPGRISNPDKAPDGKSYFFEAQKKYFWQANPPHPQATSLALFLHQKPKDQPFAFWIGIREPHRPFGTGDVSRFKDAKNRGFIPAILPDTPRVREELAAYLEQIEQYDRILGQIMDQLEDYDADKNTIIVVTSDNGMSFGRAKTQNYQYGVRVPMAAYWQGINSGDLRVEDMISLNDIAPTFLEAAEVPIPEQMDGKSLLNIFYSKRNGQIEAERTSVLTMTERHSIDARPEALGYPTRALYTKEYSLIKNYFPDRWPSGDTYTEAESYLLMDSSTWQPLEPFFSYATAKRPAIELYSLVDDPYQLHNLANDEQQSELLKSMKTQLEKSLIETGDPLQTTGKDIFSTYPWAMQ